VRTLQFEEGQQTQFPKKRLDFASKSRSNRVMNRIVETIETAVDVIERLQNAGYEAVFAGGCVRDFLLGIEPKDIDIATSATPEQVEALFEKTVATGKVYGVIRVLIDEEEFEVATFRNDSKESDGRRPDSVSFSSMKEDALRRDLTINALFFDPIADKIYDFVGGRDDIKARNIRFVGVPEERIREDKLRMLRVARFASRGGWVVNKDTAEAVKRLADGVRLVSAERIADELSKIFCHQNGAYGFDKLHELGLWPYVLPSVPKERNTYARLKVASKNLVGNKVLAWAIVLLPVADKARDILNGLRFDGDTVNSVCYLVENHQRFIDARSLKGSERMKLIAQKDFDNAILLLRADSQNDVVEYLLHIKESTPATQIHPEKLADGNDLIALGLKPGKVFKGILEKLADEQREGRISTRDAALAFVKDMASKAGLEK
jgi:tRNA nucleotidyltransferase/poly(A) polymerase